MSFGLTILFIILVFWRPQEWLIPSLWGWPLLDVITYASLLGLIIEVNGGRARMPRTPAVMLAAGLWVATIMSHLAHGYFQGILDTMPATFKFCFFTVLLLVVIDRSSRARTVVVVMVGAAVMMAIHALMQQKTGRGFGGMLPFIYFKQSIGAFEARSQFVGIFSDPNDLGQFLAAMIPLAFAVPRRLNAFTAILMTAVAYLLFQGLLATHSRGGMVGLVASVGTMTFLMLPTRVMPYAAAFALAGGLVLCFLKGGGLLDTSAQERVVFWGLGNQAFKHNPIFGIGFGMWWQITAKSMTAHNAFVLCYTEIGLFGYWFWFGLLQLGIVGSWRARMALARPRTEAQAYMRRLSGLAIAALAGFAGGGYFLSRAFVFPFFFLFGLTIAIPLIVQRLLPDEHPRLINTGRDVYRLGTLTTLFSVVYIYLSILILNKVYYG